MLAVTNEEHAGLLRVVRRLPADRQKLLVLKFAGRMSNAEIGAIMERTEGAIKSLYHRTLISLRQEFAQQEDVQEGREDDDQDSHR